jgi:hypothetical protein
MLSVMGKLVEILSTRPGVSAIRELDVKIMDGVKWIQITVEHPRKLTVLTTVGLSEYRMPVSDAYKGFEHNELCFCLPSYWDLGDLNNPRCNWVFDQLRRLTQFVREKETFFGHGHTVAGSNPPQALSETMRQSYLMMAHPELLKEVLAPISQDERTVHFLCIIPLFRDEFEYKQARSTFKFLKKFHAKNFSEVLDDYRESAVKRKYYLF